MPGNKLPRSVVCLLICLQIHILSVHHSAAVPLSGGATVAAIEAPLVFPNDDNKPTDVANFVVRQENAPLPPAVFPSGRVDVIRVGTVGARTVPSQTPCDPRDDAAASRSAILMPPCVFPSHVRPPYTIVVPQDQQQVEATLENLRNRTKVLEQREHNPKDDAVQLEDGDNGVENPQQPEEQFRAFSNSNLVAMNTLTSDESIVLDRPHEATARNALLSVTLTVMALGACVLMGLAVWRKYMQQKYGMREQLLTDEESFNVEQP